MFRSSSLKLTPEQRELLAHVPHLDAVARSVVRARETFAAAMSEAASSGPALWRPS